MFDVNGFVQQVFDIIFFFKDWDWFTKYLMFFIVLFIWWLIVEFMREAKKQGINLKLEDAPEDNRG